MRRDHFVLGVALVAFAWCAGAVAARATTAGDPVQAENDPIRGGNKWVVANFKLTPKWDRVRQLILDGTQIKSEELSAWVAWANGLQSKPVTERLLAINKRVNKDFKYATDPQVWGKPDYWDAPVEAQEKKRIDCEDYAIFKLFLAHIAGIQDTDLALAVGKIPSTGEHHAIMFAVDGSTTYILDNRSRYMLDTDTHGDFQVMYSVNFHEVWLYPSAFEKKGN